MADQEGLEVAGIWPSTDKEVRADLRKEDTCSGGMVSVTVLLMRAVWAIAVHDAVIRVVPGSSCCQACYDESLWNVLCFMITAVWDLRNNSDALRCAVRRR